jgi:hypothetical protein
LTAIGTAKSDLRPFPSFRIPSTDLYVGPSFMVMHVDTLGQLAMTWHLNCWQDSVEFISPAPLNETIEDFQRTFRT